MLPDGKYGKLDQNNGKATGRCNLIRTITRFVDAYSCLTTLRSYRRYRTC